MDVFERPGLIGFGVPTLTDMGEFITPTKIEAPRISEVKEALREWTQKTVEPKTV